MILGLPFITTFPESYVYRAFELSRVFTHTWTVNWKFLPPIIFTSKALATGLLAAHLCTLLVFAHFIWLADTGGLLCFLVRLGLLPERVAWSGSFGRRHVRGAKDETRPQADVVPAAFPIVNWRSAGWRDPPSTIVYYLFTCNFIGIVFARTMHYQFYSWYFHSLAWLLWGATDLPVLLRFVILGGIEYAFNVGDATGAATPFSSALLQQCHFLLLSALLVAGFIGRAKFTKATL